LLGNHFDPEKHICGVDVAFQLPIVEPPDDTLQLLKNAGIDGDQECVGINVSGLIYNDELAAKETYGFVADYRQLILETIRELAQSSDALIVLVPHVVAESGKVESDIGACHAVVKSLSAEPFADRLTVAPMFTDPRQIKWLISKLSWFCGTRMHSAIAGLSSGVPTCGIAYSVKTQGVFETCHMGNEVVDPRVDDTEDVVRKIVASFARRDAVRAAMPENIADVISTSRSQFAKIFSAIGPT
jgi:polysaccharide pyruvyl transferase WcaK-like protein